MADQSGFPVGDADDATDFKGATATTPPVPGFLVYVKVLVVIFLLVVIIVLMWMQARLSRRVSKLCDRWWTDGADHLCCQKLTTSEICPPRRRCKVGSVVVHGSLSACAVTTPNLNGAGDTIHVPDTLHIEGFEYEVHDVFPTEVALMATTGTTGGAEDLVLVEGAGMWRISGDARFARLPEAKSAVGAKVIMVNNTTYETINIQIAPGDSLNGTLNGVLPLSHAKELVSDGVSGWYTL